MSRITLMILLFCWLADIKTNAQPPAPGITGPASTCEGISVTITATGQPGATFRWWDAPAGGTLRSSSDSYSLPPAIAGTAGIYHFYVEQAVGGQTSPRTDVIMTVHPRLYMTVSNDTTIVEGGIVKMTCSTSAPASCTWSADVGNIDAPTGNTLTIVPTETTSYTVTATDANNCTARWVIRAMVYKLPAISGNTVVCQGSATSLTATGTGPFSWYESANSNIPLSIGATYNTGTVGASNFSRWVSMGIGLKKEVRLNVAGSVFDVTATPVTICAGDTSRLKASFLGFIKWYDAPVGGNLLSTTTSGASLNVRPGETTTYYAEGLPAQITDTFLYTGNVQAWTVPAGVTSIQVDAYGAAGEVKTPFSKNYVCKGGRVQATMNVTPGQVLYIYVGGKLGFNGGGARWPNLNSYGTRGGDATDIRIDGTDLVNRVLVAGGGGGTGGAYGVPTRVNGFIGHGGGLAGQDGGYGWYNYEFPRECGGGGSQVQGGSPGNNYMYGTSVAKKGTFGRGGIADYTGVASGGGGGGGWYGGGGGSNSGDGGGGSSYTNPMICHNVIHTQGFQDNVGDGMLYITYGSNSCSAPASRVPLTVRVTQTPVPIVSDSLLGPCTGSAVQLRATGLAPSNEVAVFNGAQPETSGVGNISSVANNFTMEFWVMPYYNLISQVAADTSGTNAQAGQRFAIYPYKSGNNAGAGVSIGSNGIRVCEQGNGYFPALLAYNESIDINTFTHVAVVYTNKRPSLYLNGALVATGFTSNRPNVYPSIGTGGGFSTGAFAGRIDNIRIWNAPLSRAEIQAVRFRSDTVLPGKTLVARYSFDGGSLADDAGQPAQPAWNPFTVTTQQHQYTYTWYGPGNLPAASIYERQTASPAANPARYYVRVSQPGCSGVYSDTVSVVTDELPLATISGGTTACLNGPPVMLYFTGSGSVAPYTFTYTVNDQAAQTISAPATVPIRYVRIKQNGTTPDHFLHLAELRAIESGTGANVALGKNGTSYSTNGGWPITNLTDNNVNNYWHSLSGGSNEYVQIDLGAGYLLDHIELVNRRDCCWTRAADLQLILSDTNGGLHSSFPVNVYQNQNNGYTSSWPVPPRSYITLQAPTTRSGAFKYKLINVKSRNGCVIQSNDSTTVTISVPPTVSIATASGAAICTGTSTTLIATIANAANPTFQWYRNGVPAVTFANYTSGAFVNGDSIALRITTTGVCASVPGNNYIKLKVNPWTATGISGASCTNGQLAAITTQATGQLQWKSGGNILQTKVAVWSANGATVAGGSTGSALNQLDNINRPFVDVSGNIYVADAGNHRVMKWGAGASAGVIVAGGNGAGAGAGQLDNPRGVYVDAAQNVYVADFSNQRVQKWAAGATSGTTVAGITGSAGSSASRLREPTAVTMDASGNLYVTECFNHRVSKWAPGATEGITVAGNASGMAGSDSASLSYPFGACLDAAGNIYVADNGNHRVVKWASGGTSGSIIAGTGTAGNGPAQLNIPTDVYVDGIGNLYIADQNNNRVQRWASGSSTGTTVAGNGSPGSGATQLSSATGVTLDASGNMYVADNGNSRIRKFALTKDTSYTPVTAGSYTVVATSLAGCTASSSAKTVSQSAQISTGPGTGNNICSSNPVMLSVTAANATGYQWRKDGVNIPLANAAVYSKSSSTAGDAGSYRVIAMGAAGCNDTSVSSAVTITAMSNSLPAAGATMTNLHTDGMRYSYTDAACRPIVNIADATGGNVLGAIQASLTIDTHVMAYRGQPYLQRHYDLQPANDGPATVTLYATQAEFDAYNNYISTRSLAWPLMPTGPSDAGGKANLSVTQYHGTPGSGTTGPGGQYNVSQGVLVPNRLITPTWNGNYWELSFPVSGFSGFFITTGSNTPLAIDLNDINARNLGGQNEVSWSTASEDIGDYFEVERSFDAQNFTRIGQVNGLFVNGGDYTFTDIQPATGINYYRLRMLDAGDKHSYSRTVHAMVKGGRLAWSAYPNPAKDQVTIRVNGMIAGKASISMLDVSGKMLRVVSMSGPETTLMVSDLPAGLYLLRYQDDHHLEHIKVHKE